LFLDELLATRLRREVRESIDVDRAAGHLTALISASPDVYVQALGSRLGFDFVICTRLVDRPDGGKESRVAGRNCKGQEKLAALRRHLGDTPVAWEASRAYTDHISDLPLLERVGTPVAVHPERRLRAVAQARGWTTLD
jgi:phosphatidylglycerophosphatase C